MASSIKLLAIVGILFLIPALYFRYRKLSSIPGPFLASFTDLYRTYIQNSDHFSRKLLRLHDKYGPLVRLGPNCISVSDPAAVSVIYTNHGEFKKADSYATLRVLAQGRVVGSIIDMQDEDENAALKRGVGGAFATKNLLDYEPSLDETLDELVQRIRAHPTFDLFTTVRLFQLDFLTRIAFSENVGHLRSGEDVWSITGPSHDRIAHWARWQGCPSLEHLLFKHPLWSRFTKPSSRWAQVALEKLHARESTAHPPVGKEKDLLQKYLDASAKHPDTIPPAAISAMVTSTISAGFDSTTVTLTSILYFLITHPAVHAKLQQELEQHGIANRGPRLPRKPQWSDVNTIPYLDAVLKEALRCNPFLTAPLERVVPAAGATIAGTHVPAGTVVGCLASVIHQNRELYGPDAGAFRPERWLTEDPRRRIAMERAALGFGSGKRVCLGKHIAELEIKKLIPELLLRFDMSLGDPRATLDSCDGLTAFPGPILVTFEEKTEARLE